MLRLIGSIVRVLPDYCHSCATGFSPERRADDRLLARSRAVKLLTSAAKAGDRTPCIDELVALLGLSRSEIVDAEIRSRLTAIQSELYCILGDIASAAQDKPRPRSSLMMLSTYSNP